jgi:hypothetical protein
MLADRMMRGEKGSEFQARHGCSLRIYCSWNAPPNYGVATAKAIAEGSNRVQSTGMLTSEVIAGMTENP